MSGIRHTQPSHDWNALVYKLITAARAQGIASDIELCKQLGLPVSTFNNFKHGVCTEPSFSNGTKLLNGADRLGVEV